MTILDLAIQYNNLQKNMGILEKSSWTQNIESLLDEDFQKIINGQITVSNREALTNQIINLRESSGPWAITEKEIIPSACGQKCTLRYVISTEKVGSFDILAVLTSKNGRTINRIDEIFYQM